MGFITANLLNRFWVNGIKPALNRITNLETAITKKADTTHDHGDKYLTETKVDAKLSTKLDKTGGRMSGTTIFDTENPLLFNADSGKITARTGNVPYRFDWGLGSYDTTIGDTVSNNVIINYGTDIKFYDVYEKESKFIFNRQGMRALPVNERITANSPNLYIDANGVLHKSTNSTERIKENFRKIESAEYKINKAATTKRTKSAQNESVCIKDILKMEAFLYDIIDGVITEKFVNGDTSKEILGFKAEDVAKYAPYATIYDVTYEKDTNEKPEFNQLSPEEIGRLDTDETIIYYTKLEEYQRKLMKYEEKQSMDPIGTIDYTKPKDWDFRKILPAYHVCMQDFETRIKAIENHLGITSENETNN